jgi:CHAT domain-containing protein
VTLPDNQPIRVLFLAANPESTVRIRLDQEVRQIEEKIRASKHRGSVKIISRWAVRVDDLREALLEVEPHVVHFSGHGTKGEEIIVESEHGHQMPIERAALAELFGLLKDHIRVVVLNACYSRGQAEAIAEHIDCTIGMNDALPDDAAIEFAAAFYQAVGYGRSVKTAFDLGVSSLKMKGIPGASVPELIPRKGVTSSEVVLVNP